ncbi:MAG: NAD(P)/FAD-dependent oxidoreductase [Flavisolibacter sp.]
MDLQDCIIVGGGPAGLNAAIVLARCRRKILVFDSGTYRNRASHGMHNYLTRDDIVPTDFIDICHAELKKYGVQIIRATVRNAKKNGDEFFRVQDDAGNTHHAKMLLVATGVEDNLPEIEGIRELYGKSVFHCPYCDGWEVRDRKLGVYARDKNGGDLALALKGWSEDVTMFTDGRFKLKPQQVEELQANGIEIIKTRIAKLDGKEGQLQQVVFQNGESRLLDALFFVNGYKQQCNIAETFGCEINRKGVVVTNRFQQTNIPGLYVAGDASRDMHFVVVAAAEGAKAGVIINKHLLKEDAARQLLLRKTAG